MFCMFLLSLFVSVINCEAFVVKQNKLQLTAEVKGAIYSWSDLFGARCKLNSDPGDDSASLHMATHRLQIDSNRPTLLRLWLVYVSISRPSTCYASFAFFLFIYGLFTHLILDWSHAYQDKTSVNKLQQNNNGLKKKSIHKGFVWKSNSLEDSYYVNKKLNPQFYCALVFSLCLFVCLFVCL